MDLQLLLQHSLGMQNSSLLLLQLWSSYGSVSKMLNCQCQDHFCPLPWLPNWWTGGELNCKYQQKKWLKERSVCQQSLLVFWKPCTKKEPCLPLLPSLPDLHCLEFPLHMVSRPTRALKHLEHFRYCPCDLSSPRRKGVRNRPEWIGLTCQLQLEATSVIKRHLHH